MKFIVTGACGFIGSHLADFCLSRGHDVLAIAKPKVDLVNLRHLTTKSMEIPGNFELVEADVRDAKRMHEIIERVKPDGIFHMAAQSLVQPSWENPVETFDTNINGTVNVFEPVKKLGLKTRIIVACSSAEYGVITKDDVPIKESLPLQPLHPYGISKVGQDLVARQYFLNFGIDTVRLRYFNQTGIRKTKDASSDFAMKVAEIDAGKADPEMHVGNLDTERDIQDIRDTVQATWLAFEKAEKGEVYNICTGVPTRIRDVLGILVAMSSKKISVVEKCAEKIRYQDEIIILGDNSKFRNATGYKPDHAIKDTLKSMFDYWKGYYSSKQPALYFQSFYLKGA
ncbi:MAG: NAD-dependent epimerase/dehydratase family protein [Candidatus Lokiarchaeota archaeon]|nr:NAD-dependent epimerase/dehydratase family protein [Candidatus Lokiarchaeota archaeon]